MTTYNKYFCQLCGCDGKWVQTILDDEVRIDEDGEENWCGFGDEFSHTGKEVCCDCGEEWTGLVKEDERVINLNQ